MYVHTRLCEGTGSGPDKGPGRTSERSIERIQSTGKPTRCGGRPLTPGRGGGVDAKWLLEADLAGDSDAPPPSAPPPPAPPLSSHLARGERRVVSGREGRLRR